MSMQIYDLLTFLLVILFVLGFVFIVMWFKKKEGERNANILLSALEKGQTIDPELFRACKQSKTLNKNVLLVLLICGFGVSLFAAIATSIVIIESCRNGKFNEEGTMICTILIAIGASLLLGYFKGKKILQD